MAEPTKPTAAPPESREKAKKEAPAIVAANESAQEKLKKARLRLQKKSCAEESVEERR